MTELSIVIPTFNEAGNVYRLCELLSQTLVGVSWEIVFVDDDSKDGTLTELSRLAGESSNVRFIRRVGRRGLSSACVEGMLATNSPYVAIMDADLQHDESLLPFMLERIRRNNLDVVVASRFLSESRIEGLPTPRERMSRLGVVLCHYVTKARLSDPLSGFFLLRREVIDEVIYELSQEGFKILMDIFASAQRPLRYEEVPMVFRKRHMGESKLDTLVTLEFVKVFVDKLIGKYIPIRFVLFVGAGLGGMLVHLAILGLLHKGLDVAFGVAQLAATYTAMVLNFALNNELTYRDMRLRGASWPVGLVSFVVICSVGAFVNYLIARYLFERGVFWLVAGALGAIVGAVWNYGVNTTITWNLLSRLRARLGARQLLN